MTLSADFDRLLESVLHDDGPQGAPATLAEAALLTARGVRQRRPLIGALDRRAWPARTRVDRRFMLAAILVLAALVGAAVLAGSRLLQPEPAGTTGLAVVTNANSHCVSIDRIDLVGGPPERMVDCSAWVSLADDGTHASARGTYDGAADTDVGSVLDVVDLRTGDTRQIVRAPGRGIVPWGFSAGGRYVLWSWCTTPSFPTECERQAMASLVDPTAPIVDLPDGGLDAMWSPDDTRLAVNTNDGILIGDGDGSDLHAVGLRDFLAWAPDGTQFAYKSDGDLFVADVDGTNRRRLAHFDDPRVTQAYWAPDGRTIAVVASEPKGSFSDTPWPIPELWLVDASGPDVHRLDVGPLCTRETSSPRPKETPRLDCTGAIGPSPGYPVRWSPDSRRVAFALTDAAQSDPTEAVIADVETLDVIKLSDATMPAWSPEGDQLMVVSVRGIDVLDADGSSRHRVMEATGSTPGWGAWVP